MGCVESLTGGGGALGGWVYLAVACVASQSPPPKNQTAIHARLPHLVQLTVV